MTSREHAHFGTVKWCIDQHGIITSKLLYSRTRVAPLVQHTIPPLELCAAALAIQVDATLTREITADIDLQSSVYWTDSMILLAYLQDDSKRYHTFVGNRVARIRSHSEPVNGVMYRVSRTQPI